MFWNLGFLNAANKDFLCVLTFGGDKMKQIHDQKKADE